MTWGQVPLSSTIPSKKVWGRSRAPQTHPALRPGSLYLPFESDPGPPSARRTRRRCCRANRTATNPAGGGGVQVGASRCRWGQLANICDQGAGVGALAVSRSEPPLATRKSPRGGPSQQSRNPNVVDHEPTKGRPRAGPSMTMDCGAHNHAQGKRSPPSILWCIALAGLGPVKWTKVNRIRRVLRTVRVKIPVLRVGWRSPSQLCFFRPL